MQNSCLQIVMVKGSLNTKQTQILPFYAIEWYDYDYGYEWIQRD